MMWFAGLSYVRLFRVKMERASACDGPYPNTTQHCNLLIINNTLMSWTFSLNMHNFYFFIFKFRDELTATKISLNNNTRMKFQIRSTPIDYYYDKLVLFTGIYAWWSGLHSKEASKLSDTSLSQRKTLLTRPSMYHRTRSWLLDACHVHPKANI